MRNKAHTKPGPLVGLAGRYKFTKRKIVEITDQGDYVLGPEIPVLPWFDNLITNTGLDALADVTVDLFGFCQLGTGTSTPSFTDTNLVSRAGSTSLTSYTHGGNVASYVWRRCVYRFGAGSVSGINLAEVGISSTANGTVFSRALLKNSIGVPATITLDSDEVLDVVYECRAYMTATTISGNFIIDGVSTAVEVYPLTSNELPWSGARLGRQALALPAITSVHNQQEQRTCAPSSAAPTAPPSSASPSANAVSGTPSAYTSGTFYRNYTVVLGLSYGNFTGGIGGMTLGATRYAVSPESAPVGSSIWGCYGVSFSPKIQKDATKTATLVFKFTWGRYTP